MKDAGAHAGNRKREAEDGQVKSPRNRMDSIRIRLRNELGKGPGGKEVGQRCRRMRVRANMGKEPAPFGRG